MGEKYTAARIRPFLFGLPRFATIFFYTALVVLSLPLIIVRNAGENSKGLHLGLITGGAALLSVAAVYVFGIYRDRRSRIDQGFIYTLLGLGLSLPVLAVIGLTGYYPILILTFFILIVSRSLIESSHLALLADKPDMTGRERYTAGIAFWHFSGSGLAAVFFGFLPEFGTILGMRVHTSLGIIAILIVVISMLGFYAIYSPTEKNHRLSHQEQPEKIRLHIPITLRHLIMARFFFLAGILMVSTFLVFVVRDYIGAADTEKTTSLLYAGSILGAVLAALPSGRIVRHKGEIPVLFFSGFILAIVTAVFFLLGPVFPILNLPCMFLYGAGISGIISAGLSLTVKLIPHPQLAGRIMALLTAATFLSQFMASISGALVLDPLNRLRPNLGYYGLLALLELYLMLGGLFLYRIGKSTDQTKTVSPCPIRR